MKWKIILVVLLGLFLKEPTLQASILTIIEGMENEEILEEEGATILSSNVNFHQKGWYVVDYFHHEKEMIFRKDVLVTGLQELSWGINFAIPKVTIADGNGYQVHKIVESSKEDVFVVGSILVEGEERGFVDYYKANQRMWRYTQQIGSGAFVDVLIQPTGLLVLGEQRSSLEEIKKIHLFEISFYGQLLRELVLQGNEDANAHSFSKTNNIIYLVGSSKSTSGDYINSVGFHSVFVFEIDYSSFAIQECTNYRNEGHVNYYDSVHSDRAIYLYMRFVNRGPFVALDRSLSFDGIVKISKSDEQLIVHSFPEGAVGSSGRLYLQNEGVSLVRVFEPKTIETISLCEYFVQVDSSIYVAPLSNYRIVDYTYYNNQTHTLFLLVEHQDTGKRYIYQSNEVGKHTALESKLIESDATSLLHYHIHSSNRRFLAIARANNEMETYQFLDLYNIIIQQEITDVLRWKITTYQFYKNGGILETKLKSPLDYSQFGTITTSMIASNEEFQGVLPYTLFVKPFSNVEENQCYDLNYRLEINAPSLLNGVWIDNYHTINQEGYYVLEMQGLQGDSHIIRFQVDKLTVDIDGQIMNREAICFDLYKTSPENLLELDFEQSHLDKIEITETNQSAYWFVGGCIGILGGFLIATKKKEKSVV